MPTVPGKGLVPCEILSSIGAGRMDALYSSALPVCAEWSPLRFSPDTVPIGATISYLATFTGLYFQIGSARAALQFDFLRN